MMRISRRIHVLNSFLSLAAALACASTPVQLGTGSGAAFEATKARRIASERCGFQLLLFIPISINGRFQRAYNDLVTKAQGDYIGDVQVRESWIYAFVGTLYCTELVAQAYPRTSTGQGASKAPARNAEEAL